MKTLFAGSIFGLALLVGGGAQAADLAVKAVAPAPLIDWSGFYVGGHGGLAGSQVALTFADDQGNSEDLRFSSDSYFAGGQAGAQWQFDQWVLGVEGTWSGTHLTQTIASTVTPGESHSLTINQVATATVRFGAAWERALFYAKAGYAGVHTAIHSADTANGITADDAKWRHGWTAAAGVDYMLVDRLVLGAEFDYYNFNFDNINGVYNDGVSTFSVGSTNGNIYAGVVRASYLFGR
jgi:outer membrane immunogenic protein